MYEFDARISSVVERVDSGPAATRAEATGPLSADLLGRMHRYWQAANYLTVGQIYLLDNPLLREPLEPDHIKPRLLGHWGTSPGLSFVYVHLNRLIVEHDVDMIYLAGPGHGGPAIIANVYLEGTYSEIYPDVTQSARGLRRLFRQFSTPGGVPSHVSVPTPGSIHEGGELGYVLAHAFGAAFDNPDLIVAAVVGDGEAETGPLAGSWKSVSFLNPARDGAVLPILHLNGYKIGGPTVLARASDDDVRATIEGQGYDVHFVEGDEPVSLHQQFAATLDSCYSRIRAIQSEARTAGLTRVPRWPAIVLRTPKGWTGPREVDGLPVEGTFRSHQVPLHLVKTDAGELAALDAWLRSYRPDALFDVNGRLTADLADLAPRGRRRMGANPHANGGTRLIDLVLPDVGRFAVDVAQPATTSHESTRPLGRMMRDIYVANATSANFRLFCPDETASNRLDDVFAVESRCFVGTTIGIDDHMAPEGRVLEVLSEHLLEGWLEGYLLTGRHGLFASYEIVIDKQSQLQWLDLAAAREHCARGASRWAWASNDDDGEPDVVLAAAGDVPTLETTAAAWWLRQHAPELRVRVVNVVDLMTMFPPDVHPHGLSRDRFVELFTADKPVVFAFHGYQRAIHEIVHGRPAAARFHVRGFMEQGSTTTPFDMVAMNGMSRYHLCIEALRRTSRVGARAAALTAECHAAIERAAAHARAHFEDPPEIRNWVWSA